MRGQYDGVMAPHCVKSPRLVRGFETSRFHHRIAHAARSQSTVAVARMSAQASDYQLARQAFPYFKSTEDGAKIAFMENAGGSQVPQCVVNAISDFYVHSYAQLGAGYARSQRATQVVTDAHRWLEVFMNTSGRGQVIIGPSTSQLAFNLASAFADALGPGDSVVLQEASHESVLGPWVRLAARNGCELRWWRADPGSGASSVSDLEAILDPSVRLVVVTHVSNLLGEILDLADVVQMVRHRAPGAQVLADGVAYAPHRAIDVSAWDVDWYLWSAYKVYGPHVGVMYGKRQSYEWLLEQGGHGPNHYFVPDADMTYKFELGGANHEACAGLLALQDYLLHLIKMQPRPPPPPPPPPPQQQQQQKHAPGERPQGPSGAPPAPAAPVLTRGQVEAAFDLMTAMEAPLQRQLLSYLSTHPAVRLVGSSDPDPAVRVPTVSFLHRSKSSALVARQLQAAGFAVRCGHMYARRLVEALAVQGGLLDAEAGVRQASEEGGTKGPRRGDGGGGAVGVAQAGGDEAAPYDKERAVDEGVVRVSLVHYNTPDEVAGLIGALEAVL